jgi:hypothetical protein
VLVLSAAVLFPRLPGSGPSGWAVLGIGAGVAGLSLLCFRQLVLRADPPLEALRRRLPSLLFLGVTGPAVGALGLLVHLFTLSIRLSRGTSDEVAWLAAAEPLGRSAALLGSSILLAIAAGLLWFVLADRLAALEQAERAWLLDE